MKKLILFTFLTVMMGSYSFSDGAFADVCQEGCPPGCTELIIRYEHRATNDDIVDVGYRDCGGWWKMSGVWGCSENRYTYCVKPGVDAIVIKRLKKLGGDPILTIPPGAQQKDSKIFMYCKAAPPGSPRATSCMTYK